MADALGREERDALVSRALDEDLRRFPPEPEPEPSQDEFYRASEAFYLAVADYFDGLPRVVMSACPFCGEPLVKAFDPWGLDGPWWGEDTIYEVSEPEPCEHFRALLGALQLQDAHLPTRMLMNAVPGPEVPFVVPHLLGLPNMIAVVGQLAMERGGPAYPIAYFSDEPIDPVELHQNWCRSSHWFVRDGEDCWTIANDVWDFELEPYLKSGQLRWVRLDAGEPIPRVRRETDTERCPFVGLSGERLPQNVAPGERWFSEPPNGEPIDPFDT